MGGNTGQELTMHEEFAYLWVTTDLMNKMKEKQTYDRRENPSDSIFFSLEEK